MDAPPLIGRAAELNLLEGALGAACGGAAQVVVIAGEAGIGKSALILSVCAQAAASGMAVRSGSSHPSWPQPYGPWVEALPDLPSPPPLLPGDASVTYFATVRDHILALAAARPLVLTFDDLHWADPDTLRLLEFVTPRLATAPVMVVAAHRDPDPAMTAGSPLAAAVAALVRLPGVTTIGLHGLTGGEVAQMVDATVGGLAPAAVSRAVWRSTGGNPLFVRQVARHLIEGRRLVEHGGRWTSDFSIDALGIPPTVRVIVQERLGTLSAAGRALLPVAALVGAWFDLDPAREVAGIEVETAVAALDEAMAAGVVEASDEARGSYRFVHAIVREAVAGTLNPSRRQGVHRRLAEVLAGGAGGPDLVAVAEHLWAGRRAGGADDRATIDALRAAALLAAARAAPVQAVELLDRALSLVGAGADDGVGRADLLALKAVVAADALDAATATAACRAALADLPPPDAGLLVVRVVAALREGTPRTHWEPLVQAGLSLLDQHRRDVAWARLAVMIDPLEPVLHGPVYAARWTAYPAAAVELLATSPVELDQALAIEAFAPRSSAETDRLHAKVRAWTDPAARRRGLDLVARDLALRHGRVAEARSCYEDLLRLGDTGGSLPARAEAHAFLALCTALLGDLPTATDHLDRATVLVADLWPTNRLHVLAPVIETIVSYVRGAGAWDELGDRLSAYAHNPAAAVPFATVGMSLAALALAMDGRDAQATALLAHTTDALTRHQPHDHGVAGALWFAAATAHRLGDRHAAAALDPVLDRQVAYGLALGPCPSLAHVGARLAAVAGESEAASPAFIRAREDYSLTGHSGLSALVDAEHAALGGAGAGALRARAAASFEALGMTGWQTFEPGGARAAPAAGGLSAREAEVLALLATGLTNKEMAARLRVSLPTVNRHVANIYVKLGVRNRAEATAWALRRAGPTT